MTGRDQETPTSIRAAAERRVAAILDDIASEITVRLDALTYEDRKSVLGRIADRYHTCGATFLPNGNCPQCLTR